MHVNLSLDEQDRARQFDTYASLRLFFLILSGYLLGHIIQNQRNISRRYTTYSRVDGQSEMVCARNYQPISLSIYGKFLRAVRAMRPQNTFQVYDKWA